MDSIQYFKTTSVFYFYVISAGTCGKPDISKFLIEEDMLSKSNTFWSLIFYNDLSHVTYFVPYLSIYT